LPAGASTIADAARSVSYVEEISPQLRGCAILTEDGEVLAATGEVDAWAEPSRELIAAIDAAGGEPAAHSHISTPDGEAFCVREAGLVAVAVGERLTLASLMIFDLRSVLRDLAVGAAR
jgi:hypothetical protein